VALLSIGEEEMKGNELTREAYLRLKNMNGMQFVGNVEGREVFAGNVDVIVCDGFIGNVALKISEGLVEHMIKMLRENLGGSLATQLGAVLSRKAFQDLNKKLDYSEYGGAPLLGVKGVTIISHGRSNANAIKNAIRIAAELSQARLNEKIEQELTTAALAGKA
jgi:glycerol-3-phosphate acyltransferase PlsX